MAALCSLHNIKACPAHACKQYRGKRAAPGVVVGHSEGPVKARLVVDVLEGHVQLLEVILCTGRTGTLMSMPLPRYFMSAVESCPHASGGLLLALAVHAAF